MIQVVVRRSILLVICLVCASTSAPSAPAQSVAKSSDKQNRPNIVFILADDLGYSDLGCYGGEIETPMLDELAAGGLRFTQFYNTGRCWPTRAALLTGYYAQQVRRDKLPELGGGGRGKRPVWAPLLSEFLKPRGYRNYHSGKWHIDGPVLSGGFDRSFNMRNQGNFFTAKGNYLDGRPIPLEGDESDYYATAAVVDHALACLTEHQEQYIDQPFFHYIAFTAPHFPLHATPEDIARYRDKYLDGWDAMREQRFDRQKSLRLNAVLSPLEPDVGPPYDFPKAFEKLGPDEINRPLPWLQLTDGQRAFQARKMAIHAAMVDRMDREIGRVVKQLQEMGAYENTIIFFASDNGASAEIMVRDGGHDPQAEPGSETTYLCLGPGFSSACNTPFRRHKTWVHEGGIASPFIVHWPAGLEARGELRHTPSHVIDFVPTVFDLLDLEKPSTWSSVATPDAPGRSLVPAFKKDTVIQRDSLWWMHEDNRAIRIDDWKLVAAQGDPWELYDLSVDRAETKNLATKFPEKVKLLEDRWNQLLAEMKELVAATAEQ